MAAIPGAPCASAAHRGVMRALCRVAVLSGLIIAGWLVGAGISHADEDPAAALGSGLNQVSGAAPSDDGSSGSFDVDNMIKSTVRAALSTTPTSRAPLQSPAVKRGVLTPLHKPLSSVVNSVRIPQRLTPVLSPVTRSLPGPPSRLLPPPAPVSTPAAPPSEAAAPQAAPPVPAAVATPPAAVLTPDTRTGPSSIMTCAPALPVAQHAAGPPVLGRAPTAPGPVAPPDSTPVTCMIGSTGGGTSTRSAPDVTQVDSRLGTSVVPLDILRHPGASDLPRSLAARPSTSPD